jgi:hypothetical protein
MALLIRGERASNDTEADARQMSTAAHQSELFPGTLREPHPMRRSRVTNDAVANANQATAAGRRVADLYRAYINAMGNPVCALRQAEALAAAEHTQAAEAARVALRDGAGSTAEVARCERLAARAVAKLGIDQSASAPTSIRDRLRRDQQQRGVA